MHSKRAKQNFTLHLKEQLLFLQQDLKHEREALKRVQRFVWWDGKFCPCCNYTLRTRPRNTKNRKQLQEILTVQRM